LNDVLLAAEWFQLIDVFNSLSILTVSASVDLAMANQIQCQKEPSEKTVKPPAMIPHESDFFQASGYSDSKVILINKMIKLSESCGQSFIPGSNSNSSIQKESLEIPKHFAEFGEEQETKENIPTRNEIEIAQTLESDNEVFIPDSYSNYVEICKDFGKNMFVCDLCCKRFKSKNEVLNHMTSDHLGISKGKSSFRKILACKKLDTGDPVKVFICKICNTSCSSISHLRQHHNRFHSSSQEHLNCRFCSAHFKTPNDLRRHCYREHNRTDVFKCPREACTFTANRYHSMVDHIRKKHDIKEIYRIQDIYRYRNILNAGFVL